MNLVREFFSSGLFMPHGHCYLWKPALLWLQVLSNGFIAAAYVAISAALAYLVYRIRDLPFKLMYLAFGGFIISCGFTHLFDIYVIWKPVYWADGAVRAITAVASIGTAAALPALIPQAIALARGAQAAHERGIAFEQAAHDLGAMYERTRELEQLKTQFFANVSHELRTPLALIVGPIEKLLAATNLTDSQIHDLELVSRNARTLLKHVNDLLDVSKLEAGKLKPEYAEVDVGQVIRLAASNFDALATERQMAFVLDVAAPLRGQVDLDKLQRVVLNLLSNAFKFTPAGGRVRCAARLDERGWLHLEVCDSGPGVQPENREIIFERFRQLEGGSSRRFGGTGLGLAIAKDFVTLHGGTIQVRDAPEGGAAFIVEMPLSAPAGVVVRAAAGPREGAEATLQILEELRTRIEEVGLAARAEAPLVLVVEDNLDMNRFLRQNLEPTFRVASAFDGREGLAKAVELKPDLILSDIMMPGMSGDELVSELRKRRELDAIPIVMLTAKADDELRLKVLRAGAQDYVMKPFSLEEVRVRVGNLVVMKRARDVLQAELDTQLRDLEGLAKEVTARKRELETAVTSLRVARDAAERAAQIKGSFLGMVSHELRTPITALRLQLEILLLDKDTGITATQRELLGRMTASTGRLATLIESLLEYTRIESGKLAIEVQDFDLGALAREVVDEFRGQAERKGLELQLRQSAEVPHLRSDLQMVRLILSNLVSNAIKFTVLGSVEVSLDVVGGRHRLVVSDTGPGIAPEDRVRVFEPFAQLERPKQKHLPGIGLGLALVREMTTALDGEVHLESQLGRGTTFTVLLASAPEKRSTEGA